MKTCDLETGLGQVAHAAARLQAAFAAAKEHWNDEACRKFEEQHLRGIPPRLQQFASAAQRLRTAIERAERDCSEERDDS